MDISSVTICWTLPSATPDADGYVIHYHSEDGSTMAGAVVKGGTTTKHRLNGLELNTNYTLTVRAYQDILGPPSNKVNFSIPGELHYVEQWPNKEEHSRMHEAEDRHVELQKRVLICSYLSSFSLNFYTVWAHGGELAVKVCYLALQMSHSCIKELFFSKTTPT